MTFEDVVTILELEIQSSIARTYASSANIYVLYTAKVRAQGLDIWLSYRVYGQSFLFSDLFFYSYDPLETSDGEVFKISRGRGPFYATYNILGLSDLKGRAKKFKDDLVPYLLQDLLKP